MADKLCMNHFLWQNLEDSDYREQLQWVDRKKLIFRVLWMHAGRATFDKKRHQKLFYKYREYRGHKSSEDPKQCFGMALKKSPSVVPHLTGTTDDDWRYYRFTRRVGRRETVTPRDSTRVRTKSTSACATPDTPYTTFYDYRPHSLPPTPPIDLDGCYSLPHTPHSLGDLQDSQPLPEDLQDIDVGPLRQIHQCPPSTGIQETYNLCQPWPSWGCPTPSYPLSPSVPSEYTPE